MRVGGRRSERGRDRGGAAEAERRTGRSASSSQEQGLRGLTVPTIEKSSVFMGSSAPLNQGKAAGAWPNGRAALGTPGSRPGHACSPQLPPKLPRPAGKPGACREQAPGLGALALPQEPSSGSLAPVSPFPLKKCVKLFGHGQRRGMHRQFGEDFRGSEPWLRTQPATL